MYRLENYVYKICMLCDKTHSDGVSDERRNSINILCYFPSIESPCVCVVEFCRRQQKTICSEGGLRGEICLKTGIGSDFH